MRERSCGWTGRRERRFRPFGDRRRGLRVDSRVAAKGRAGETPPGAAREAQNPPVTPPSFGKSPDKGHLACQSTRNTRFMECEGGVAGGRGPACQGEETGAGSRVDGAPRVRGRKRGRGCGWMGRRERRFRPFAGRRRGLRVDSRVATESRAGETPPEAAREAQNPPVTPPSFGKSPDKGHLAGQSTRNTRFMECEGGVAGGRGPACQGEETGAGLRVDGAPRARGTFLLTHALLPQEPSPVCQEKRPPDTRSCMRDLAALLYTGMVGITPGRALRLERT